MPFGLVVLWGLSLAAGESLVVVFDRKTGLLTTGERNQARYLASGALENVCRPQTGLDTNPTWGLYDLWLPLSPDKLSRTPVSAVDYPLPDGRVRVESKSVLASQASAHVIRNEVCYTIAGDGHLVIDCQIVSFAY